MKCIDCPNYSPPMKINGVYIPASCLNDGNVSKPKKDIYCGEMEEEDENKIEKEKNGTT